MSLNFTLTKIENYMEVCWLDIPADWLQKELEANYRNGSGYDMLREDPEDDTSPFVKYRNPVTDALIWGALDTQIGEITKANYQEVWARLAMGDALYGHGRLHIFNEETEDYEYRSITIDEVYQHIGLSTNVFPKETITKWFKRKSQYFPKAEAHREEEKRLKEAS